MATQQSEDMSILRELYRESTLIVKKTFVIYLNGEGKVAFASLHLMNGSLDERVIQWSGSFLSSS